MGVVVDLDLGEFGLGWVFFFLQIVFGGVKNLGLRGFWSSRGH